MINRITLNSKSKSKKISCSINYHWPTVFTIKDKFTAELSEKTWPLSIQSKKKSLLSRVPFWMITKDTTTSEYQKKTIKSCFFQVTKSAFLITRIHTQEVSLPTMNSKMLSSAEILMSFSVLQMMLFSNGTWGTTSQWKLTEPYSAILHLKLAKTIFVQGADWVWFTSTKITNRTQIILPSIKKLLTSPQQSATFQQTGTKVWFAPCLSGRTMQRESFK